MTVGDCKIKTLALLDENDLTVAPYTSDADIAAKLPLFITMGQRVIAQQQKIVKTAVFTEPYSDESVSEGVADPLEEDYLLFDMPSDFYQLRSILKGTSTESMATFTPDGKMRTTGDGKWLVYYYAMPTEVTAATADTTALAIADDCALALPYYVAANILLADGDSAWVNYMSQFNMIMSSLTIGKAGNGARIV
ncbi:MAG TPA: hypothetical protein PKH29_12280, partial [Oscillospiraceae bacterium]|nr:hypothetical protein [Oscillospiraceae bacterium]